MTVDRFRLSVGERLPASPLRAFLRSVYALGLGAVIALTLWYRVEVIDDFVPWPSDIWEHAVNLSIVYFCVLALVAVLRPRWRTDPEPGAVTYERRSGGLTIRTPVAATTWLLAAAALGLIGLGACALGMLIWSRPPAVWLWGWESTCVALCVACLPAGIDLAIRTIAYAITTRGVTLTPTRISAQAEGSRLTEVPWEELRSVTAPVVAATKLSSAGAFLMLATDWEVFTASSAAFDSDVRSVQQIIEFYRRHPEHRGALDDPRTALELVQRAPTTPSSGGDASSR